MFLDCAPAYFEYLSKAFFHGLPTMLCKIVGVYQIGFHNRVTSKRTMEQVAVMQVSTLSISLPISKILHLTLQHIRTFFMAAKFLESLT